MNNFTIDDAPSGAKLIPLSRGKFAIVDERDFEYLSQWKWSFWPGNNKDSGYAARVDLSTGGRVKVTMHRLILSIRSGEPIEGLDVDHINRNKLDNRLSNLRLATRQQNGSNRGANKRNKSGYKGVNLYDADRGVWRAQIMHDGKKKALGYYATAAEAALAYNDASRQLFGEFGYQNTVEGVTEYNKLIYRTSKEYQSKGVSYHKGTSKWIAYTKQNGKRINLGYFKTEQEAIDARSTYLQSQA